MGNNSKQVFAHGLAQMIIGYNKKKVKMENISPDILEDHLAYYDATTLGSVSEYFTKNHPERMTSEPWMKRFKSIVDAVDFVEFKKFTGASHYSVNAKLASLYFDAVEVLKTSGDVNLSWTEIFDRFKDNIETSKYLGQTLVPIICPRTFKENPESAKSFMYDIEFKKLKAPIRTAYYKAYIKAGLLDKKIARRIRSDGAEKTARDAIECLLENLDAYDNPKSLLTQFTDIKHSAAQHLMAKKAPDYLVPFMMGFECSYSKSILEKRAMEITKAKEQKKESSNG